TLLPNTECVVIDLDSGQAVGRGQQGEVWVRGPLIMQGYLGQAGATAATIDEDGWLHTGDVGYVDDDGDVFIVDRVKELIKYKGLQVAPAELEATLLGHRAGEAVGVRRSRHQGAGGGPKAWRGVKRRRAAADDR